MVNCVESYSEDSINLIDLLPILDRSANELGNYNQADNSLPFIIQNITAKY